MIFAARQKRAEETGPLIWKEHMMTYKQLVTVLVGAGIALTASAQAGDRKDLWGQGRVEIVFGGGAPGEPCYGCDARRTPPPDHYPVYRDEYPYEYGDRDVDFERGKEFWKDRAEAMREREKDRREALRERAKDRQEWEREQQKAAREFWKEEEKARREWEKERDKFEREAWKEQNKARRESWKR